MKKLYCRLLGRDAWIAGWLCHTRNDILNGIMDVVPIKRQTLKEFKQTHKGWYEADREYYWCGDVPGAN